MSEALIIDAVRSPIGKKNGTLSTIRGDDLAAQVLNALLRRNDLDPAEVEDVQLGCVTQIGEQGWNIGRMVPLAAGWPETVCGTTVDRQCGSSMQTNFNAATAIWSGQLDLVVSAGVEMMSRVPMGSNGGDLSPQLLERWQIIPIDLPEPAAGGGAAVATRFAVDEAVRRDTSLEKLAALAPAFIPDGKVTAGNSSQIVDGAAAVLVASEAACSRLGLEPRARFVSFGLAGVDPRLMLHGNPQACGQALARAELGWDDVAVVE